LTTKKKIFIKVRHFTYGDQSIFIDKMVNEKEKKNIRRGMLLTFFFKTKELFLHSGKLFIIACMTVTNI